MSTYTLSGSGTQALTAGTTALHVTITTLPAGAGLGSASPPNYYHVALLRAGDAVGFWEPWPVEGGPQWFGLPNGTTQLAYAIQLAGVLTVVEVIGGTSPFVGPAGSAGAAGSPGAAGATGAPGASGAALLAHALLTGTATSIDLTGISAAYTNLELWLRGKSNDAATMVVLNLELNGDTTAGHYTGNGTASTKRIGVVFAGGVVANNWGFNLIRVGGYSVATTASKYAHNHSDRADGLLEFDNVQWTPSAAAAVNEIKLIPAAGSFIAGTEYWLYGMS